MKPSPNDRLAPPLRSRPSSAALESALTNASRQEHWSSGRVVINHRTPLVYSSFFSTEVVLCSDSLGREFQILCKYGDAYEGQDIESHHAHGHRRGVAYEAMVYRQILTPTRAATPAFYGSHQSETGETWLFIEYLRGAARLTELAGEHIAMLKRTGEWLGQFHAECEPRVGSSWGDCDLAEFTFRYATGWVDRTTSFAEPWRSRFPWIRQLKPALEQWAIDIASRPTTVIHGEFYPQNILVSEGSVLPVDWESAAVGPAEIDLAAVTEGWSQEAVEACEQGYGAAYEAGVGKDFALRIESARLYWDLRWLGDRREWTVAESLLPRLERVGERAARLGYLS